MRQGLQSTARLLILTNLVPKIKLLSINRPSQNRCCIPITWGRLTCCSVRTSLSDGVCRTGQHSLTRHARLVRFLAHLFEVVCYFLGKLNIALLRSAADFFTVWETKKASAASWLLCHLTLQLQQSIVTVHDYDKLRSRDELHTQHI